MRSAFVAAAAVSLASCAAVAENRVTSALTDAGLSKPVATCIADRMVDKLSIEQLRRISRLKDKSEVRPAGMSIADFLIAHRGDLDPEVYSVLARAGVGCAFRG